MIPELGKIYQGDCLAFMKTMDDKCVDLVLTDPPYGIGEGYESFDDSKDNLKNLVSALMPEILRVSKRALITCGVDNIHLYPKPDWILSWVTPAGVGSSKWGFCCWQPILAYGPCPYLGGGLGRRHDTIIHTEASEKNGHPCPKPIQFWKKLLIRGSVETTDIVFDPFMGSGTTAIACEDVGRRWIGTEMEPKYIEIASNRISTFKSEPTMFAPVFGTVEQEGLF